MKTKGLSIVLVSVALFAVYVISIVPNIRHSSEWNRAVKALKGLPADRLDAAVQAYTRNWKTGSGPLPATVPLHELVSGGYLRADEAAAFDGTETTISLTADETTPGLILIRVYFPDGCEIVELADGSILRPPK